MQASGIRQLLNLLANYKWQVARLSLLIAFSALLGQLAPQFVRIVIDDLIPRADLCLFIGFAFGMLLFYGLSQAINFASMYFSFSFTQKVISDIRLKAYERLLSLPITRFTKTRSGIMVSKVVNDVNALESMIQAGASRIVGQLFSLLVVMIILLIMNWILALIALVSVAFMAGFTIYFQTPLRRLARKIRGQVAEMTGVASEAISSAEVVKTFANEPLEFAKFKQENDAYKAFNLQRRKQSGLAQLANGLSSQLGMSAVLLVGAWLIVIQSASQTPLSRSLALTTGELTAFLLYLRNFYAPVQFIMNFNNLLQSGLAALERVQDLLQDEPQHEGEINTISDSHLVFDNVKFSYPETKIPALNGLNLTIKAGETIALVGPSGAGKSTIVKLISRLYDPDVGEISIGAVPLGDYSLKALRNAIAYVPQDPTLFSGSVKDNIAYAKPEAVVEDIMQAAKLASAYDFIMDLPQGFHTEIGERGVKLSGGQKQRIAIARALLKQASILILDEATSSLDSESETIIQFALDDIFKQHNKVSSIVIAHRLSTIRKVDRIFVLDQGRVVESGTHHSLLAQNGLYTSLYNLQFQEEQQS